MHSQSLQNGARMRSTSNSSRFTKKMMASNLLQSDTKANQKANGNVIIYKTTEFVNSKLYPNMNDPNQKNQSKSPQNNMDMNQYNFEYSYQDPVYQVYTENQAENEDQSNYVTPNFASFQVQGVNSAVFNMQNQQRVAQSGVQMQMSHVSPDMTPEMMNDDTNSMSTYVTQNNQGYVNGEEYSQSDMIYSNQQYNMPPEPYNPQNPMVYGEPWSKKKVRQKMKGFKKFRPHSNNVRTVNQIGYNNPHIWGNNTNFRKKFDKKSSFGPKSGLSTTNILYNNPKNGN